jgi:hypothetical protein
LCCLILIVVISRGCIVRILISSLIFYPRFSRSLPTVSHIFVSILTAHPLLILPHFSSTILLNSTPRTSHIASASTYCSNSTALWFYPLILNSSTYKKISSLNLLEPLKLSLFNSLLLLSFVATELFSHRVQFIIFSLISHMWNSNRIDIPSRSTIS